MVRCFENENVTHVAGRVDPIADVETINTELALADLATVEKALARHQKPANAGDKEARKQVAVLERLREHLNQGSPARSLALAEEERGLVKPLCLLTLKPLLYVANVDEGGFGENLLLRRLEAYAAKEGAPVVPLCAALEAQIADLSDEDKMVFLTELGLAEPGLNRLIRSAYALLGLQTYFTAGPKEVRAWTIHRGDTAPRAAAVIHTDFERGFIRAEVIAFADFIACGGEQGAKDAGKLRLEGKDYVVQDGDVIHFRFNV